MTSIIVQVSSIIATIGCILFFLKGINKPLEMACYAVAMLPFQVPCPLFTALKVNELAIVFWMIVFIIFLIRKKVIICTRYAANIFVFMLCISGFNVFKYFQSGNIGVITELIRLIVAVFFPLTVSLTFFNEIQESFSKMIRAWNLSATIVSILSLISIMLSGYSIYSYLVSYITTKTSTFYIMKFAGSPFFADPNSYGGYLVISIGMSNYLYRVKRQKKYFVSCLIELFGLMTTLSRGAVLAFIISICIVMFINRKTKLIGALSIITGLTSGVSFLIPFFQNDRSAMSRFDMWETAFSMFKDHPILGVGLSNYTYLFNNYGSAGVLGYNPYTHNLYLKILVESGIIGETIFVTTCIVLLKLCFKHLQSEYASIMIIFGVLGFLIQGMTVEFFTSNYFWFLVIVGLIYMQRVNDCYETETEDEFAYNA